MGESLSEYAQKILPIIRGADGRFLALDDSMDVSHDKVSGRFSKLISEWVPFEEDRQVALGLLGHSSSRALLNFMK